MGLLKDYKWLQPDAEWDQKDSGQNEVHHLGFWDFLDKLIQEEKKEANEKPTSWKDVLIVVGGLLLISFCFLLLALLFQLAERWINGIL